MAYALTRYGLTIHRVKYRGSNQTRCGYWVWRRVTRKSRHIREWMDRGGLCGNCTDRAAATAERSE